MTLQYNTGWWPNTAAMGLHELGRFEEKLHERWQAGGHSQSESAFAWSSCDYNICGRVSYIFITSLFLRPIYEISFDDEAL
jgi:hypothetical protein